MEKFKMWIGGEWVESASGKTYRALNPATEEEIAEIPLGEKERMWIKPWLRHGRPFLCGPGRRNLNVRR